MLKDTIKPLRTEQGLSQDELAERVHVVRQTVSKWERGTSVPDADSLVALARALGVSAAELLVSRNGSIAWCAPSNGRSSARRLWCLSSVFLSGCQTSNSPTRYGGTA